VQIGKAQLWWGSTSKKILIGEVTLFLRFQNNTPPVFGQNTGDAAKQQYASSILLLVACHYFGTISRWPQQPRPAQTRGWHGVVGHAMWPKPTTLPDHITQLSKPCITSPLFRNHAGATRPTSSPHTTPQACCHLPASSPHPLPPHVTITAAQPHRQGECRALSPFY
jgi:hypothetical protein